VSELTNETLASVNKQIAKAVYEVRRLVLVDLLSEEKLLALFGAVAKSGYNYGAARAEQAEAAVREARRLLEEAVCDCVEFGDDRLDYTSIQIHRTWLDDARTYLDRTKESQ